MAGPHPSTAAVRCAVREALADVPVGGVVLVACSGGADSMALAEAAAHLARGLQVSIGAVIVDHGLQEGSAQVAHTASRRCRRLGLEPVLVRTVEVTRSGEGPEAQARAARYAALEEAAERSGAVAVLLGHTLDDQAEQVLLGLARGSGARSLAGMPPDRGIFRRPLLGVTRQQTRESCRAEGVPWWEDPMNEDPAFLRVRARRALADLERDLGPGIAAALARSAALLRADADHLDLLADTAFEDIAFGDTTFEDAAAGLLGSRPPGTSDVPDLDTPDLDTPDLNAPDLDRPDLDTPDLDRPIRAAHPPGSFVVPVAALRGLPAAVRTRVWRRLLLAAGAPPGQLGSAHVQACDALLTHWHGQGPTHVPGGIRVGRKDSAIHVAAAPG